MKAIVIYNSQTGFTQRYAEWIAEAVGADCLALSAAKDKDLGAYDAIVFGGWALAGGIAKLSWFKRHIDQWPDKKLIAFCVGASPIDSPEIEPALRRNFTEAERQRVRAFYCPGGLDYARMSVPSKLMMKALAKMLASKKDQPEAERTMARMLSSSYDISDRKYIEPILAYLNA